VGRGTWDVGDISDPHLHSHLTFHISRISCLTVPAVVRRFAASVSPSRRLRARLLAHALALACSSLAFRLQGATRLIRFPRLAPLSLSGGSTGADSKLALASPMRFLPIASIRWPLKACAARKRRAVKGLRKFAPLTLDSARSRRFKDASSVALGKKHQGG